MKRREFIALIGGAATGWPIRSRAQEQHASMRRVAVLVSGAAGDPEIQARLKAFRGALQRLGWTDGKNLTYDVRFAQGDAADYAKPLANELLALHPDVILSDTTPITAIFRRETKTTPVVFVQVSDPIGAGFITTLARPGSNAA